MAETTAPCPWGPLRKAELDPRKTGRWLVLHLGETEAREGSVGGRNLTRSEDSGLAAHARTQTCHTV